TTELELEETSLGQELVVLVVLVEMTQNCIAENARIAQDQGEYQKRYNGLVERYEKAKVRFDEVTEAIAERSAKGERLAGFIRTLEVQKEPVAEFDERLLGGDGGLCDGGRGRRHEGSVPGWDGDLRFLL
ncbi:MAG: recombinase, partial [Selenomonadaceae bacterium]|nr:recombinase [Selenomonadaceae bacterium]